MENWLKIGNFATFLGEKGCLEKKRKKIFDTALALLHPLKVEKGQ